MAKKYYVVAKEINGVNVVSVVGKETAKARLSKGSVDLTREITSPEELVNGEPFGGIDYMFSQNVSEEGALRSFFGSAPYPVKGSIENTTDDYGFPEIIQKFSDGVKRKVGCYLCSAVES